MRLPSISNMFWALVAIYIQYFVYITLTNGGIYNIALHVSLNNAQFFYSLGLFFAMTIPVSVFVGCKLFRVYEPSDSHVFSGWDNIVAVLALVGTPFIAGTFGVGLITNIVKGHDRTIIDFLPLLTVIVWVGLHHDREEKREKKFQERSSASSQERVNREEYERQRQKAEEEEKTRRRMELSIEEHRRRKDIDVAAFDKMASIQAQYQAIVQQMLNEHDKERFRILGQQADFYRDELTKMKSILDN